MNWLLVAIEDKETDVRKAACTYLTDQATLAKVATEDNDGAVRETAMKGLTKQNALATVALQSRHTFPVGGGAFEKLTDQVALLKVAMVDRDFVNLPSPLWRRRRNREKETGRRSVHQCDC